MHRKILFISIAIILATLPAVSSGKKKNKPQINSQIKSKSNSAAASRGKRLYRLYQCADCHSINGEGNKEGVSLDRIGTKRTSEFLLAQILDPEKHVEKNSKKFNDEPNLMPAQEIDKAEARAIVSYLKTLR
ncbi:MAG: c-type cytochrome [Candidatus Melainabacteria bacterium]|nr:c-type cytochrome [Candidatus Melainabacteria bacterium]